jgi:hypothetical protein
MSSWWQHTEHSEVASAFNSSLSLKIPNLEVDILKIIGDDIRRFGYDVSYRNKNGYDFGRLQFRGMERAAIHQC